MPVSLWRAAIDAQEKIKFLINLFLLIPFSSVYIVFAIYEKIRIYFLYTLLEIYGLKKT